MAGVIVTGGSRGVGRAITQRFDRAGDKVLFCYSHDQEGAETTQRLCPNAVGVRLDLSGPTGPDELLHAAQEYLPQLDVLVNNAGIYPHARLLETPGALLDQVLNLNLAVPFRLTQLTAKQIAASGGGAIVNVTSINAFSPEVELAAYDASKAALAQLTRTAALELGPAGVRVNAVAPGLVADPQLEQVAPQRRAAFIRHAPLRKLVQPDEVGEVVFFLASPAAAAITGQTIIVDAGVTLAGYMADIY
jgi:NAD(P)-dependent dehydrogenase (short-subunit alcohol dehydrogenase family)